MQERISAWAGLALLVIAGIVALAGPVLEARQRGPEGPARAYLAAVERGDVDGALGLIDPAAREALRERVTLQQRNRYAIGALVLGRPSVWDRLTGRVLPAAWVTVTADVTTIAGDRWSSTSTAPVVERDGVWYLAGPLFA
ncbi:MAG: hypothetical protein IT306_08860 [Chloroflexi bacterium]|nr:hypothetical protein [Chloroflexota bacterium]